MIYFQALKESKKIIANKKFKNREEYQKYCKVYNHSNFVKLNHNPHRKYKMEWIGWGDFLGTNRKRGSTFLSFQESKKYIKKLDILNQTDWRKYVASKDRNIQIPSDPRRYYSKEWISWNDFLGK